MATAAFFIGNSSFANSNGKSSIYNEINNSMSYPITTQNPNIEEFAIIEFTIDNKGEVQVLESNSSSEEIIKHVKKELSTIKFDSSQYKAGSRYVYRFNFLS